MSKKSKHLLHGEIASNDRYNKIRHYARTCRQIEVFAVIEEAKAEYGEMINCAMLHRYLLLRFPFAVCWGSLDHVMTEIGGCLYDKNGLVAERVAPETYSGGMHVPQWFAKSFRWPKTNTIKGD